MNKNIVLILLSFVLVSCGVDQEKRVAYNECKLPVHSSVIEGVQSAQQIIGEVWEFPTYMGIPSGDSSLVATLELSACTPQTCKAGYKRYHSGSRISALSVVCIKEVPCKSEKFILNENNQRIIQMTSNPLIMLSEFVEYVTNTTNPSCMEEDPEFSCADPGYSVNSSDPENPTCVLTQSDCSEEEAPENSLSTQKTWDTESNSYGSCSVLTCEAGYSVSENSCVADPIYGCMDSRADNYNAAANTNDMSCMCSEMQMPYNPETGCEDMPAP